MIAPILSTLVGLGLMAAPGVLGYGGAARTSDHIVGPIVATFACVAIWEVTRSARWVNVPLGLWLLIAPWVLGYGGTPMWNALICGAAAVGLACVRGRTKHRFGGGWKMLWQHSPAAR
jgi:hypothetical protein